MRKVAPLDQDPEAFNCRLRGLAHLAELLTPLAQLHERSRQDQADPVPNRQNRREANNPVGHAPTDVAAGEEPGCHRHIDKRGDDHDGPVDHVSSGRKRFFHAAPVPCGGHSPPCALRSDSWWKEQLCFGQGKLNSRNKPTEDHGYDTLVA